MRGTTARFVSIFAILAASLCASAIAFAQADLEVLTSDLVVAARYTFRRLFLAGLTALVCDAVGFAVLPLALTSILCEALMVWMGIGVKVATLPVIALGVGIGVDYALYVLSVMLAQLRAGATLKQAYAESLRFTGKVVMLTGITLGLAVATWAFSPIKFQADMGLLLGFMFIWNMLGALVLLPALAFFLLKPVAVGAGRAGRA